MAFAEDTAPAGAPQGAVPASEVDHTLRDRMIAAVERLEALAEEIIADLDRLQGDADHEPVLGAPEIGPHRTIPTALASIDQTNWAKAPDCDEREPGDDEEPSLGSIHGTAVSAAWGNQERWAQGLAHDQEDEHDGREPEDDEHNLGRSEAVDQSRPEPRADDLEPSLGLIGGYSAWLPQTLWAQGDVTGYDPEWQCEDEAAQCDDEGADSDIEGHGQASCYAGPTCPVTFVR